MENATKKTYLDNVRKCETLKYGTITFIVRGEKGTRTAQKIYRNEQMLVELLKEEFANGKKGAIYIINIEDEVNVLTEMSLRTWLDNCSISVM